MSVLYIFAGLRKNTAEAGVTVPDTPWYGFTHLKNEGIHATILELENRVPKLLIRLLGFRGKHLLTYFFARSYDVVFGSALIYPALLKRVFGGSSRYVLFNISTTRILREARPFMRAFLRFVLGGIDRIVCLSEAQRDAFVALAPQCAHKTIVMKLGTDVDYFDSLEGARAAFVLAAGRDNGRDYKTVIEVARALPRVPFRIVCSPRNLKDVGAIPSNVTIVFDVPPEKLAQLYKEARALLLLTHPDAHPDGADCSGQTVLLDACAAKVPVIATEKAYIREYIPHDAVRLVPPYDVGAVVRALETVTNPERDEYALRAYAHVRTHLTSRSMAHELATLFNDSVETYAPCPLCDGESFVPWFTHPKHGARYGACKTCGAIVLDRNRWPKSVGAHYETYYAPQFEGRSYALPHFSRRAQSVRAYVPQGGSVCEIGAASGEALYVLMQEGYEVAGVELSHHAVHEAKKRYDIALVHGTIHDARFPEAAFDAVLMHHVFEHLTDPQRVLEEVHRILKPGGVVILEIPNPYSVDAWFSCRALLSILDYPHHTLGVPPRALTKFLTARGLVIESTQHAVSYMIARMVRKPEQRERQKKETQQVRIHARTQVSSTPWKVRARMLLARMIPGMAYTVVARKPRS